MAELPKKKWHKSDYSDHAPDKFVPEAGTEMAEADPLSAIEEQMTARGFATLWTPTTRLGTIFDDGAKKAYLRKLATTGRHAYSAAACGVARCTIHAARKRDPIFAAAIEEAKEYFRDMLVGEMYRRGVAGFKQGVVGGKNRNEIIMVPTYSDRMMELLARIHIAELRPTSKTEKIVDNSTQNTLVSPQFNIEDMPAEELSVFKTLVEMQAKRHKALEDKEEKVINPEGNKDAK